MGSGTDELKVIGIGASAGGLEALEQMFDNLPNNLGFAYVIIQHFAPHRKSLLDELMARHTRMPVMVVSHHQPLQENHVYLIHPQGHLMVRGNQLISEQIDTTQRLRWPIDHFLVSLGREYKHHAVAVILSGTGSDGTRGCAVIRENQGTVLVQTPETCRFRAMPMSVIRQNHAHEILSPSEIAEFLKNHVLPHR